MSNRAVLVTGATGYVGGRLVPLLLERGHTVRVLARDPDLVADKPWGHRVEVHKGDLADGDAVRTALRGVDVAYYLVHSMCAGGEFEERDRRLAETFAAQVEPSTRVVYLGGIQPDIVATQLSPHLRSRKEVGEILRRRAGTLEFRAGPIVGAGSASFEIIRYLTERLPVMLTPRWVENLVRPIGVHDILQYLAAAAERPDLEGCIDVGTQPLAFRQMLTEYARVRELSRSIIGLPFIGAGLVARWIGLITPVPNCVAVPLVHGMSGSPVGDVSAARLAFPEIEPVSYEEAVQSALGETLVRSVPTRWSDSLGAAEDFRLEDSEGLVREVRARTVEGSSPEAVFRSVTSIGGERGWITASWAWRIRGLIDQLVGGPGLRRGRRHPEELLPGEALDFWRVEAVVPNELLRLRAEMKVPGQAWLQWEIDQPEPKQVRLTQAALFRPRGFWGWVYWYAMYPAHRVIFDRMIDGLVADAHPSLDP